MACRIPRSAIVRTEAQQDAYDLSSVDFAAIAIVTGLSTDPSTFAAELQTKESLRGAAPHTFALGGDDLVIVTCYPQRHDLALVRNLRLGDEVLVFSSSVGPAIPFDILKLDEPRAVRLLAILRSERTAPQ
ncbi:MAG: hypothetical protein EON85_09020 [Brevundimonas sp.]|nr:MAG: hypothetical protein EON85_09020 [Brevundimonas sp.]